MTIYIDPRLIGRNNFDKLTTMYPNINFITEINSKKDIEALITMPKIVKEINLDDFPKLNWIQYFMAGYDGVDLEELSQRNIAFCNAQDIFSKTIAEDVFAKILFFNRNISYYVESKKVKQWKPLNNELELTNSTVLILGVGSIGKELAKRFKAFEMNVIGYRKTNKSEDFFDEIITEESELNIAIQRADYVILALPLTKATTHLFDKQKFEMMKKDALFVNVARGKIVNQNDLVNALKNNLIRGAALDVVTPEPLSKNNPLWELDNVFLTPHNASTSPYVRDRLFNLVIMNLDLYVNKKQLKYQLN